MTRLIRYTMLAAIAALFTVSVPAQAACPGDACAKKSCSKKSEAVCTTTKWCGPCVGSFASQGTKVRGNSEKIKSCKVKYCSKGSNHCSKKKGCSKADKSCAKKSC